MFRENTRPAQRVGAGIITHFDAERGFGFARQDGTEIDVFVHARVLQRCGLGFLSKGQKIRFVAEESRRGWRATEVALADPPTRSLNEAARVHRAHGRECCMAVRSDGAGAGPHLSSWQPVSRSTGGAEPHRVFRRDEAIRLLSKARTSWTIRTATNCA
jgi:cold shock CspA family protein